MRRGCTTDEIRVRWWRVQRVGAHAHVRDAQQQPEVPLFIVCREPGASPNGLDVTGVDGSTSDEGQPQSDHECTEDAEGDEHVTAKRFEIISPRGSRRATGMFEITYAWPTDRRCRAFQ